MAGKPDVVRARLTGSIIGTNLLVLSEFFLGLVPLAVIGNAAEYVWAMRGLPC